MSDGIETVFVVGSGAEENPWPPVTNAIHTVAPNVPVDPGSADHANFWMAKVISLRRSARAVAAKGGYPNAAAYVDPLHDNLRRHICDELHRAMAAGALRLRPSLEQVLTDPYWGDDKQVVTTNWDTLIEERFRDVAVAHVHGTADDWKSLYLPSDYAFDPAHDDDTQQRMFVEMDRAIKLLWRARRVCIFGLGLDPLDSELALVVETGLNGATALIEVQICNLASEEQKLRKRLALLVRPAVARLVTFRGV